MSSYLVSPNHVLAIVASVNRCSYDNAPLRELAQAATELYRANAEASEEDTASLPAFDEGDVYEARKLSPVELLKAIQGYRYQLNQEAGEAHRDGLRCSAYRWCSQAQAAAIRALPGYEAAEWSIR